MNFYNNKLQKIFQMKSSYAFLNSQQPTSTNNHLKPTNNNHHRPLVTHNPMYSSSIVNHTIISTTNNPFQNFGRFIKEEAQIVEEKPFKIIENGCKVQTGINQPLTFRSKREAGRPKIAASMIFPTKTSENINQYNFGSGTLQQQQKQGASKLQLLLINNKKKKQQIQNHASQNKLSLIESFKSQSSVLNTKLAHKFGNNPSEKSNLYFKLPTRKSSQQPRVLKQQSKQQSLEKTVAEDLNAILNQSDYEQPEKVISNTMFKKKAPAFLMPEIDSSKEPKEISPKLVEQNSIKKGAIMQRKEVVMQRKSWKKEDFAIGKKMGKGQYGQVVLVRHKLSGFICGMKIMSKKQIKEQKYTNQILRQLKIQFYLNHRYVSPLYGYFQDSQNIYLLIEFCNQGQLYQKMRKQQRMAEEEVSPIIREVCEGLNYIHNENIIHRDIKPQNILFQFGTVKICDFGWAVHSKSGMRTTISGTPLYYSPELVLETEYDEKIDIWSIGMMTYECLLGKIPFRIYSQLDLKRIVSDQINFPSYVDVSDDAKDFILKIMKKQPQERPEIKQILKHPFITKHIRSSKLRQEISRQFDRLFQ